MFQLSYTEYTKLYMEQSRCDHERDRNLQQKSEIWYSNVLTLASTEIYEIAMKRWLLKGSIWFLVQ